MCAAVHVVVRAGCRWPPVLMSPLSVQVGMYLGLSGGSLRGEEVYWAGVTDYFSTAGSLPSPPSRPRFVPSPSFSFLVHFVTSSLLWCFPFCSPVLDDVIDACVRRGAVQRFWRRICPSLRATCTPSRTSRAS